MLGRAIDPLAHQQELYKPAVDAKMMIMVGTAMKASFTSVKYQWRFPFKRKEVDQVVTTLIKQAAQNVTIIIPRHPNPLGGLYHIVTKAVTAEMRIGKTASMMGKTGSMRRETLLRWESLKLWKNLFSGR